MRGFSIAQFDYIRTLVEHDVAHNANILAYLGYPPTDDKYKQAVVCSKIGLSILEILQTENARMLVELQRYYENQSIEDEIEDPEPHGSRDTFVPHPDGPDAERFNPLQD